MSTITTEKKLLTVKTLKLKYAKQFQVASLSGDPTSLFQILRKLLKENKIQPLGWITAGSLHKTSSRLSLWLVQYEGNYCWIVASDSDKHAWGPIEQLLLD